METIIPAIVQGQIPAPNTADNNIIPAELMALPQWICWRAVPKNNDPTKMDKQPINPHTGQLAKTNDPTTWGTFNEAVAGISQYGLTGLGLVFSASDGLTGFDFDDCIDNQGDIHPEVAAILKRLGSYAEISPSGKGIKVWVKAKFALDRGHTVKKDAYEIEVYKDKRYFTVTAEVIPPYTNLVESPEAERLYHELFPQVNIPAPQTVNTVTPVEADRIKDALQHIPADNYEIWLNVGFGLKWWAVNGGDDATAKALWEEWSKKSIKFNQTDINQKWQQIHANGPGVVDPKTGIQRTITVGSLIALAKQYGWIPPKITGQDLHLTEYGNAERLVRDHGQDVRYTHDMHKWLRWQGTRWQMDENSNVVRIAKKTVRAIYNEALAINLVNAKDKIELAAMEKQMKAINDHAKRSESDRAINAMINLAASEPIIAINANLLDRDENVINLRNGTLDLTTLDLRHHNRDDLITKIMPVELDINALCPTWEAFLAKIMGDTEMIAYLQRAVGYSLTASTREQNLFFMYGTGSNGKSTFVETLMTLMGDYAQKAPPSLISIKKPGFEGIPNDMARLRGARLVVCSELGENECLWESRVKDLTGGDIIVARYMRGEYFEFNPTHKLWIYGNHRPVIYGGDNGIWRRIHLIPFEVAIPENEKDKELKEKLKAELPGILMWAIAGYYQWLEGGLKPPAKVVDATAEYRSEMDTMGAFIEEECIVDPIARVSSQGLYDQYKNWAETRKEYPVNVKKFTQRLRDRGFIPERTNKFRGWRGIRLVSVTDPIRANNQ